jgi:flagellar biosynthesis regulator FlaF
VSQLSESTTEELRAALVGQLKNLHDPSPELAKLLRKVGAEAREKKIKPEELVVVFKQMWNSLVESTRAPGSELQERMRQNLVTLCIQAYYAE